MDNIFQRMIEERKKKLNGYAPASKQTNTDNRILYYSDQEAIEKGYIRFY